MITTEDIPKLRLLNQRVESAVSSTPAEVVCYMGALQGQEYHSALWAIGLRAHVDKKAVLRAISNHQILRTWPQRGTLHFVPAADAKWMVTLSAGRLLQQATRRREQLGLDDVTLAKAEIVLTKVLNQPLSRPKIMEIFEKNEISTKDGRGYHILWYLSQTAVTCLGPMEGKQQTFVLLDSWVAKSNELSREESIATLARRYFNSHGPATIQDFMWWSGLIALEAKAGLEANKSLLKEEKIDGKSYWLSKTTPHEALGTSSSAYLLPGFDEYILGYKDRSAQLKPEDFTKVVPGSNGMFAPTMVLDGQVIGTWKRTIKKDRLDIELKAFNKLTKAQLNLFEMSAAQYGDFLGLAVKLT